MKEVWFRLARALYGAYQTSVDPRRVYFTMATSAILFTVMVSRFYRTGKFMPAGLVSMLQFLRMLHKLTKIRKKTTYI